MKVRHAIAYSLVGLLVLTSGCASEEIEKPVSKPAQQATKVTLENVSKIKKGMSYEEVTAILGPESRVVEKNEEKQAGIFAWDGKNKDAFVIISFTENKVIMVQQQGLTN